MKMEIQTVTTMITKKIFLGLLILSVFNCANEKTFNRNLEDETSFKNELINSLDKGSVSADELFKEEDVFYVFPPYYTLKDIKEQVDGFSETFYYKKRKKGDYIDVEEGVNLIISTEKGSIKKCLPISRKEFLFARLKSNKFEVNKTSFTLKKSDNNVIKIELIIGNK